MYEGCQLRMYKGRILSNYNALCRHLPREQINNNNLTSINTVYSEMLHQKMVATFSNRSPQKTKYGCPREEMIRGHPRLPITSVPASVQGHMCKLTSYNTKMTTTQWGVELFQSLYYCSYVHQLMDRVGSQPLCGAQQESSLVWH